MNIDFIILEKATPAPGAGWSTILLLMIIAFIVYGVYTLYGDRSRNSNIVIKNRDLSNLNINKLITKVICMISGIVGASIGAYTIYSEKQELFGYNYESPLSDHEIGVIILIVISVVVFIVGTVVSSYND